MFRENYFAILYCRCSDPARGSGQPIILRIKIPGIILVLCIAKYKYLYISLHRPVQTETNNSINHPITTAYEKNSPLVYGFGPRAGAVSYTHLDVYKRQASRVRHPSMSW